MKREYRIARHRSVSEYSDDVRVSRVLAAMGVSPTRQQLTDFQNWRIREDWNRYKGERMDRYNVAQARLDSQALSLPNGKKGERYEARLDIDLTEFGEVWMEIPEDTGLSAETTETSDGIVVSGTPVEAGDFVVRLCAKLPGWVEGDPVINRSFRVAFNPDPRDLWRELPVPDDIKFPKDNADCAFVHVAESDGKPHKNIVAASKRGRSHAQEGKPRDDDFRVSFNSSDGWYVMAVADGAGSARYSREGSAVACATSEAYCRGRLAGQGSALETAVRAYAADRSQENLKPLVEQIHSILFKAATESYKAIASKVEECAGEATMRDFSTTLLLAVCRRFEFGWFIASFGVGDGVIAVYNREDETVRLLNEPDGGEYAGQTRFLTMDSIFRDRTRIKMSIVPDFTALMLMSDGVSDPFFETDANLSKKAAWDELWKNLASKVDFTANNAESCFQLLEWLDFWSPGNHDDRTIAILY